MKTNYILFIVLSMAVLFGWNAKMAKRAEPVSIPAAAPATLSSTAAPSPAAPAEAPLSPLSPVPSAAALSSPVEKTIGRHRISFDAQGAGILQWEIEDGLKYVPLLLPETVEGRPLAAFPGLAFSEKASGPGKIAWEAVRPDGLVVRQTYAVDPDGHLHSLEISLTNGGEKPVDASHFLGWGPGVQSGDSGPKSSSADPRALALEGKRLMKLKPGDATGSFLWFGVDARYFLAAFPLDPEFPSVVRVEKKEKLFSAHLLRRLSLAPGESKSYFQKFYLGPKKYDDLSSLGLGLERAVNFGFFASLGKLIHRVLLQLDKFTGNFGWAIIALTFLAQIILSPLTMSSFKHSQKMKTLQPQMKRLREMYKSNPQKLNQEMLALYKRHGLRFMGMEGCLPALIQMPVFFALYSVLLKTYELRHAPWIGWIKDLSVHDPVFALPILMGGAMFLQQKMTMSSMDPTQKQMMYIMPVMFTFIFLKMPSGLVIYWLTQSLLTLAIQLVMVKRAEAQQGAVL